MGYDIITFPELKLNNIDVLVVVIKIEIVGQVGDNSINASDQNLLLINPGTINISFDFDASFLMPAELTCDISDIDLVLSNYMFENSDATKEFEVSYYLNGTALVDLMFRGNVIVDSFTFDYANHITSFDATPKMNKLSERPLTNMDVDPPVHLDPLNYGATPPYPLYYLLIRFDVLLRDIFRNVNENLQTSDITIINDWLFRIDAAPSPPVTREYRLHELYAYYPWAIETDPNTRSLSDLLKTFAFMFNSVVGMSSWNKVFFMQLFHFDSSNLQTIGKVLSHTKSYKYGIITYYRYETVGGGDSASITETIGDFNYSQSRSRRISDKTLFHIKDLGGGVFINPTLFVGSWSLTQAEYESRGIPDTEGQIVEAKNEFNTTWNDNGVAMMLEMHHHYRSDASRVKIELFEVEGINYEFIKNFIYNGTKYQLLGLSKNLTMNTSMMECLNLGAV